MITVGERQNWRKSVLSDARVSRPQSTREVEVGDSGQNRSLTSRDRSGSGESVTTTASISVTDSHRRIPRCMPFVASRRGRIRERFGRRSDIRLLDRFIPHGGRDTGSKMGCASNIPIYKLFCLIGDSVGHLTISSRDGVQKHPPANTDFEVSGPRTTNRH